MKWYLTISMQYPLAVPLPASVSPRPIHHLSPITMSPSPSISTTEVICTVASVLNGFHTSHPSPLLTFHTPCGPIWNPPYDPILINFTPTVPVATEQMCILLCSSVAHSHILPGGRVSICTLVVGERAIGRGDWEM